MKSYKYLIGILFLALILRLIMINQSLWLDEAIGAIAARDYSFSQILSNFIKIDNHPPFYYLLLRFVSLIFGYSELALRLPSIVFGVLTILVIYKIDNALNQKSVRVGYLLALLLATSQIHIYYSQEVRMYSLAIFLVSLSAYLFINNLKKNSKFVWILFGLVNTLILLTDYLPILMFAAFFVWAIVNERDKKWWLNFILSYVPVGLIFVLWLPTFLIQSANGKWLLATVPDWSQTSGAANFRQVALVWMKYVFGRITFENKNLYYLMVAFVSFPYIYLFSKVCSKKTINNFYLYWFFVPVIGALAISTIIPAFNYFRIIFVLPAFYGLLMLGYRKIKKSTIAWVLYLVLILINLVSLSIYYTNAKNQREDWKGAIAIVNQNIEANEVVLFSYPEPFAPYRWYEKNGYSFGATDSILATQKTINITKSLIDNKSGVYYFEYLSGLSDPEHFVESSIRGDFVLQKTYNFNGVGFVKYYKR